MTTLTATSAAEQLLTDVRNMLARHDGAESLDELRELAGELSTALRRVRGRISRIAKRDEPAATKVAAAASTSNEPASNVVTPVTPAAEAKTQPVAEPPRAERTPPMSTPTPAVASLSTATNTRRRWLLAAALVLAVVAVLVMLAGCSLPADPLPPGSDQFPTTDTLDEPEPSEPTACDIAREAFLTGSDKEIEAALRQLIADKSADATAREYAQYYLERDAGDPDLQDMDKSLIQMSCS